MASSCVLCLKYKKLISSANSETDSAYDENSQSWRLKKYRSLDAIDLTKHTQRLREGTCGCEGGGRDVSTLLCVLVKPTRTYVQCGELCSVSRASLDGRGAWRGMDTCICMAESLCCLPETITAWLISYIPTQNKKCKTSRGRGHIMPMADSCWHKMQKPT